MSLTLTALEALYAVALAVGLREGEASALRWEDIDLDAGTLTVRHALLRMKGRVELAEPKTARSQRTIALPDFVVAVLRAHRIRQLEERLAVGPLHWSDVLRSLHRHLAAAGLPPRRFHDLRTPARPCCSRKGYTRASSWKRAGTPLSG